MSSTLRDQLLKAGLVTEKQVRESERNTREAVRQHRKPAPGKSPPRTPPPPSPQQIAAEQKAAAKAARDAELNRQRQEAAKAKERALRIKQLIEQHRLPKITDSEDRFHFVAGKKLRFILVDAAMREGINRGTLFIIRYNGLSEVVNAETAQRIRECDERAVVQLKGEEAKAPEADDPYKDFVVPDDLKW